MENKKIIENVFKNYGYNDYPENYKETLIEVLRILRNTLDENLLNVTLGGSGGKNKIIEGWSDLDVYVILKNYDIKKICIIQKLLSNMDIHIGLTIYNFNQVNNNLIDFKTKIMIYEKNNFRVNPTLYGKEYFPEISYEEVYLNDLTNYPQVLQVFKRMYIEVLNEDRKIDKVYIKKLLVLMKCILSSHRIFAYGYNEVFQIYSNIVYQMENPIPFDKIFTDIETNTELIKIISKDIIEYTEKGNLFKLDKSNTKSRKLKMVM